MFLVYVCSMKDNSIFWVERKENVFLKKKRFFNFYFKKNENRMCIDEIVKF